MIETLLIISILLNGIFIWYIIQLIRRFMKFQEALDDFVVRLEEYEEHIDVIHGLEKFYGDQSLVDLLKHSKDILEGCQQFRNLVLPIDEESYEEELNDEET